MFSSKILFIIGLLVILYYQGYLSVENYSNPANLTYDSVQMPASDYHVNYPFDAYPNQFGTGNRFQVKLPYDNLETRHYKKRYHNKTTPRCSLSGDCDSTPGYYKSYDDYFDHPKKLNSFALGYSVTGHPYNNYHFPVSQSESKSGVNLREPMHKNDYPEWYDYSKPRKEAQYIGYPFNYDGKKMR